MKHTEDLKDQAEKTGSEDEKTNLNENAGTLLEDEELDKVAGGRSEQKITYECYYCGDSHVLTFCTDLKIIPNGLKKIYGGATRYFCTYSRKYFYTLKLPNGGIAILDDDMKIVR